MPGLQAYILERTLERRGRLDRRALLAYYTAFNKRPKRKDQIDAITKALERMIARGWLVGYCVRTAQKWYIKEVQLTPKGRRAARKLRGEQQKLPLIK
ncbi:hypothetical protein EPN90_00620 [Patescibacteria group bacterium]|nr:MAG: hypothetical protein EPN90_00620 [Patescibacteria group bacterium]